MSLEQINLGWGNPYFLLQILNGSILPKFMNFEASELSYPPKDGLEELRNLTKQVIKETTGLDYDHIIITNGATSAINTILRYEKPKYVYTHEYGYPLYDKIIKGNKMVRVNDLTRPRQQDCIDLIDSPSNPTGKQVLFAHGNNSIWDAVYHSSIYTYNLNLFPKNHKYYVGSYSKLLGLAGCRVGFIAINDPFLRDELYFENWKDLAGVSALSQKFLINVLKEIDLPMFLKSGEKSLNYNREEFQKIEHLFGNQLVNEIGMFYCAKCDDRLFKFLDKCNIQYVKLDSETIRLSMGHENEITKSAISRINQMDKIK